MRARERARPRRPGSAARSSSRGGRRRPPRRRARAAPRSTRVEVRRRRPVAARRPCAAGARPRPSPRCARRRRRSRPRRAGRAPRARSSPPPRARRCPEPVSEHGREAAAPARTPRRSRARMRASSSAHSGSRWQRSPRASAAVTRGETFTGPGLRRIMRGAPSARRSRAVIASGVCGMRGPGGPGGPSAIRTSRNAGPSRARKPGSAAASASGVSTRPAAAVARRARQLLEADAVARSSRCAAGRGVRPVVEADVQQVRAAPRRRSCASVPRFISTLPSPSRTSTRRSGRASATPRPIDDARPIEPIM